MTLSTEILAVLLLSVIASATNTDLANNTNILLILLLALAAYNATQPNCPSNTCPCHSGCGCRRFA